MCYVVMDVLDVAMSDDEPKIPQQPAQPLVHIQPHKIQLSHSLHGRLKKEREKRDS